MGSALTIPHPANPNATVAVSPDGRLIASAGPVEPEHTVMIRDALTGDVRWAVKVGAPCHWQPVVSEGWAYAGLEDGSLIGFGTGDPLDSDWPMWGGGGGHNGKPVSASHPGSDTSATPTPWEREGTGGVAEREPAISLR